MIPAMVCYVALVAAADRRASPSILPACGVSICCAFSVGRSPSRLHLPVLSLSAALLCVSICLCLFCWPLSFRCFCFCFADTPVAAYLNRADVQAALHVIPSTIPGGSWVGCSSVVNYSYQDLLSSMLPTYEYLLANWPQGRYLVFSGDMDGIGELREPPDDRRLLMLCCVISRYALVLHRFVGFSPLHSLQFPTPAPASGSPPWVCPSTLPSTPGTRHRARSAVGPTRTAPTLVRSSTTLRSATPATLSQRRRPAVQFRCSLHSSLAATCKRY